VQSAVKRTGYADFWELYRRNVLPKETRNYVPIILAVTIMAKNPEQYGLDDVNRDQPIPYDTVKINYPIDLRLAAQCVNRPPAELQDLNPSLLRLTTPKDQAFELHLPVGTSRISNPRSQQYQPTSAWVALSRREGRRRSSLLKGYHTTAKAISGRTVDDNSLDAQTRLVIPVAAGKFTDIANAHARITRYRAQRRHGGNCSREFRRAPRWCGRNR
jgi:membrane-bound lytic murein transglycosylase D